MKAKEYIILNCPFCNGLPEHTIFYPEADEVQPDGHHVTCSECSASTKLFYEEKDGISPEEQAINSWNQRV